MATTNDMFKADLNVEIMLQINQRLWERGCDIKSCIRRSKCQNKFQTPGS